jgi:hypothetical protein
MKLKAYKGEVAIDPESITSSRIKKNLKELEALMGDQKLFDKLCIFIFLLCDLSNDNPLVDRPYNTKREEALEVAFGKDLKRFIAIKDSNEMIRDLINKTIEIYLKEVNTDEQKDIATYSTKMDQFRIMLHGMKPRIEKNTNKLTQMVSFSTNMDIINSVLKDIVSLISAKASMVALHTTGSIPKHLRGRLSFDAQEQLIENIETTQDDDTEFPES